MVDLYKILDLDFNSSYSKIFKKFIEYSKLYHPDFDDSKGSRDKFIDINIAFYILEYDKFKKVYNGWYKKRILNVSVDIDENEAEKFLKRWINEAKINAEEYMKISYKKFYLKIPKRESLLMTILDFISNVF